VARLVLNTDHAVLLNHRGILDDIFQLPDVSGKIIGHEHRERLSGRPLGLLAAQTAEMKEVSMLHFLAHRNHFRVPRVLWSLRLREIKDDSGVNPENIRHFPSFLLPLHSSLLTGFIGDSQNAENTIVHKESADARQFPARHLFLSLDGVSTAQKLIDQVT
jgi:hypothetical protein